MTVTELCAAVSYSKVWPKIAVPFRTHSRSSFCILIAFPSPLVVTFPGSVQMLLVFQCRALMGVKFLMRQCGTVDSFGTSSGPIESLYASTRRTCSRPRAVAGVSSWRFHWLPSMTFSSARTKAHFHTRYPIKQHTWPPREHKKPPRSPSLRRTWLSHLSCHWKPSVLPLLFLVMRRQLMRYWT